MSRAAVSARRKPKAAEASEGAETKTKKVLGPMDMKTVTTAIRFDMWQGLNNLAVSNDISIQSVVNKAVFEYLTANGYTITVAPED